MIVYISLLKLNKDQQELDYLGGWYESTDKPTDF